MNQIFGFHPWRHQHFLSEETDVIICKWSGLSEKKPKVEKISLTFAILAKLTEVLGPQKCMKSRRLILSIPSSLSVVFALGDEMRWLKNLGQV